MRTNRLDHERVISPGCACRRRAADVERGLLFRSSMLLTILLVVLVLALVGGGFGHSRYGYAGWSPAGIIVVILLVMFFTGHLNV